MYRVSALLCMAAFAAMTACGGSEGVNIPTEPPKTPSISISFSLDTSFEAFPGAMLRAKGDVRDESGVPVSTGITWELNGVGIAQDGEIERSLTPGNYNLCLSFRGKKECRNITVEAPKPITGKVFLVSSEGVALASNVEVCASWRSNPECASISVSGEYSLLTRFSRSDSVEFSVRCKGACPNLLLPTDTVENSAGLSKNLSILKRDWRINNGVWRGSVVSVDPNKAYAKALDKLSFWNEDPRYFWRQQDFPIKVFFDRDEYGVPITSQDSTVMWGYIDELESELGKNVFVPAGIQEVTVIRSPGTGAFYKGGIGISIRPDSFPSRGGSHPETQGYLEGGRCEFSLHPLVSIRMRLAVKHELLHALGFGHTPHQSWYPGVMTNFQRSWEPTHGYLAVEEVAYMEAWNTFMELAWKEKSSTMLQLLKK